MKKLIEIITKWTIIGIALIFMNSCTDKGKPTKEDDNSKHIYRVEVLKVKTGSSNNQFTYSGTVIPKQTTPMSFLLPGTVVSVKVEEGDKVKKGQVLAQINNTSYQNTYQATQASLFQAEDAYNRLKTVHDKGSLPEIKWEEVKSKLKQAQAADQIAFQNLSNTTLKAPVNGIIGMRKLEIGETTTPGLTILNIVTISEVYVKVSVPENEINKIIKGQTASINIPAIGSQVFSGKVEKIGVLANAISKTYDVKIQVINQQKNIRPGMACDVILNIDLNETRLTIPYKSVLKSDDGKNYVYKVDPNSKTVEKETVELGSFVNNEIEIISGISQGDLIVTEGQHKLFDKARVTF